MSLPTVLRRDTLIQTASSERKQVMTLRDLQNVCAHADLNACNGGNSNPSSLSDSSSVACSFSKDDAY